MVYSLKSKSLLFLMTMLAICLGSPLLFGEDKALRSLTRNNVERSIEAEGGR